MTITIGVSVRACTLNYRVRVSRCCFPVAVIVCSSSLYSRDVARIVPSTLLEFRRGLHTNGARSARRGAARANTKKQSGEEERSCPRVRV